ncbi:MAG: UrcA family protein [Proteobacteria bacterium]|nr:UrcA family protein [Pseudomonadota bacterium]
MTINTAALIKRGLMGAAAGAFSLGLAAIPAHAQDTYYDNDDQSVEGVTVTAPREVGRSAIGAPIEAVSASRVVDYRDLDVGSDWGARELKVRIQRAAASACDQLDRDYPNTVDDGNDCYRDAVRHGLQDASYQIGYRPYDW